MSRALMDPKTGYYARKVSGIGARGDFATSASVGDRLARAIAAWLVSAMKQNPQVRNIIEVGGGEGSLMAGVRKHLGWWLRRRFRWIMVEQSAPLMARQKETLGSSVTWADSMTEALSLVGGQAFIYHNEFLDALPFVARAMARFERLYSAERDERIQCQQDRRFASIPGAMWEGLERQFENRPRYEINKILQATTAITSEYRANRITVDFVPKDGRDGDATAAACNSLFRADMHDSFGADAVDNAFDEAMIGGMGGWQLRPEYEDDEDADDDRQRIRFIPVTDADSSIYLDSDARGQVKLDADYGFLITGMTPQAYEAEFDDSPQSWPKGYDTGVFDWALKDVVYVAQYYEVERKRETVTFWEGLDGSEQKFTQTELNDDPTIEDEMLATGFTKVRTKVIRPRRVRKYIMSGGGVIDDCGYIAGKYVPLIVSYGKYWVIDGITRAAGVVRPVKDAVRIKNMQLTTLVEVSASTGRGKPVLTPEEIAGHENAWASDNIDNSAYLLRNPMMSTDGQVIPPGALTYTQPAVVSPAAAALFQIADADLADMIGAPQAGEKVVSNTSGKAVELIQTRIDGRAALFIDNHAKAVAWSGTVWLSMAKELYRGRRTMKGIGAMDNTMSIELMRPVLDDDGAVIYENDLANADLDVNVEVGPSSRSRRDAVIRQLLEVSQIATDPQTQKVIQAAVMMNMEGEGVSDIREFFRKQLVGMGVVKPTEAEKKAMDETAEGQQPDPQAVYLAAAATEAEAKAAQARAQTVLTIANAEKVRAETARTEAETVEIMSETDGTVTRAPKSSTPVAAPVDPEIADIAAAKAELELERMELENERLEAELAAKRSGGEVARNEADAAAAFAETAGLMRDAVAGLVDGAQAFQQAATALGEKQAEASEKLATVLSKPRRIVREKGRIVGIEA